jgi:hypothetical protein
VGLSELVQGGEGDVEDPWVVIFGEVCVEQLSIEWRLFIILNFVEGLEIDVNWNFHVFSDSVSFILGEISRVFDVKAV